MNSSDSFLPYVKLQLNIEHQSLEDCYAHGYECALADTKEEDNPYPIGSRESEYWSDGWWASFYGEEPLFAVATNTETDAEEPAANDYTYYDNLGLFVARVLEATGVLAVSAAVGYQVLDLVA